VRHVRVALQRRKCEGLIARQAAESSLRRSLTVLWPPCCFPANWRCRCRIYPRPLKTRCVRFMSVRANCARAWASRH